MSLNINLEELNNLDLANIGSWPPFAKTMMIVVFSILVAVLSYFLLVDEKITTWQASEGREQELRQFYRAKYAEAVN